METQGLPWKVETEIKDLSEIDIGIMPLPDTEWAKGKCGLKGLQYMALGIATLMSPVGVNADIVKHGVNGYLPKTEQDWVNQISLLIENAELRKEIAMRGKETVEKQYSVQVWKQKYLDYFNQLIYTN